MDGSKVSLLVGLTCLLLSSGCENKSALSRNTDMQGSGLQNADISATAVLREGKGEAVAPRTDDVHLPPIITGLTIEPESPTKSDTIKAVVSTHVHNPKSKVVLIYQWKVNGNIVAEGAENALSPGQFKRKDKISVIVTAEADGMRGVAKESKFVMAVGTPPTLQLAENRQKLDGPVKMQLIGKSDDGDEISYALKEPLEGMTVDAKTGVITWNPDKRNPGTYSFSASAQTSDGASTTQKFTFSVQ
ncbi:MAG TPA: Ig domain-containing protein [Dissulfurispiraceae bacterium]|nr:Ig domain-containing protein [Dissulfurispiraceae bacterium]